MFEYQIVKYLARYSFIWNNYGVAFKVSWLRSLSVWGTKYSLKTIYPALLNIVSWWTFCSVFISIYGAINTYVNETLAESHIIEITLFAKKDFVENIAPVDAPFVSIHKNPVLIGTARKKKVAFYVFV